MIRALSSPKAVPGLHQATNSGFRCRYQEGDIPCRLLYGYYLLVLLWLDRSHAQSCTDGHVHSYFKINGDS